MIEWISRQEPGRAFLDSDRGSLTYGDLGAAVDAAGGEAASVIRPVLDPASVRALLAAMANRPVQLLGPEEAPSAGDPTGAACVIRTSGSSGPPKGVRLTWANWEAACSASEAHLGHGPDDVWLLALPLHHVAGLSILLRSLHAGGSVRMLDRFDPTRCAAELGRGVTWASVVPTMLHRILQAHPGPYSGVRGVMVGGGPIPDGLLERAVAAGLPVLPSYGMTETCGQLATLRPGSPLERTAHLLPGVELRIDGGGRIAVRGPMVSPGYMGESDRAPDDWLVTGDLGELDGDSLRVLGRADSVIVTGGENVSPERVEAELIEIEGVEAALVAGVPSEEWGSEVVCAYAGTVDPEAVVMILRDRIPGHMVPKRWRRVEAIPTTALSKPDRAAVARLFS